MVRNDGDVGQLVSNDFVRAHNLTRIRSFGRDLDTPTAVFKNNTEVYFLKPEGEGYKHLRRQPYEVYRMVHKENSDGLKMVSKEYLVEEGWKYTESIGPDREENWQNGMNTPSIRVYEKDDERIFLRQTTDYTYDVIHHGQRYREPETLPALQNRSNPYRGWNPQAQEEQNHLDLWTKQKESRIQYMVVLIPIERAIDDVEGFNQTMDNLEGKIIDVSPKLTGQ